MENKKLLLSALSLFFSDFVQFTTIFINIDKVYCDSFIIRTFEYDIQNYIIRLDLYNENFTNPTNLFFHDKKKKNSCTDIKNTKQLIIMINKLKKIGKKHF